MNPWLLIGPIAPLLWSLAAIIDKYLVTRYFGGVNSDGSNSSGSVGSFILFSSLFAGIICIPLLVLIDGIFQISIKDMAFLVAGGVFGVTCVILYLIALQEEELSLIVPWWQTIPLFGYLFGYLFLGEAMTKGQFIAGAIILIGASPFQKENCIPYAWFIYFLCYRWFIFQDRYTDRFFLDLCFLGACWNTPSRNLFVHYCISIPK